MAGLASISGLASGLDTASIVSQLMQLERRPQTNLKSELQTAQSNLTSLQGLNSAFASLQKQAATLADAANWSTTKAASSNAGVSVTAGTGAVPGSLELTVNQVATTHRLTFNNTSLGDAVVVSGGTEVSLTINGETTLLDTGDGTLDGLVSALNASGTGVTAAKVKLNSGEYRLLVSAAETGQANAFTLTNADGSDLLGGASVSAGQDAEILVGSDLIHSSTNTFTDLTPGLNVTVSAAAVGSTADLTVTRDSSDAGDKVAAFVKAVNEVLTKIDSLTGYNAETKTSGPLAGNSIIRDLRTSLLTSVYPEDNTSMATVGVQTDRNGKLVFDADAFKAAFSDDAAGTMAMFTGGVTTGFAARVDQVADRASNSTTGSITLAIESQNQSIKRTQDSIDSWDRRLELRQSALERQFTALETALSAMNSQSEWLSGQLASLVGTQK